MSLAYTMPSSGLPWWLVPKIVISVFFVPTASCYHLIVLMSSHTMHDQLVAAKAYKRIEKTMAEHSRLHGQH